MKRKLDVEFVRHHVDDRVAEFERAVDRISIHAEFSECDLQVLELTAYGRTNLEIAAELGISRAAVNKRVGNLITWAAVRLNDEHADRRTLAAIQWRSQQRREGNALAPKELVGLNEMGRLLFPLVAIGWSNQRIAAFLCASGLCLSEETIDSHVDTIRVWVEIRAGRPASRARAIAYFWGGQWQFLSRAA